jgi:hypothetical protein
MTNITIKSNFIIITNVHNYELTMIISLDSIQMIYFNQEISKGAIKDLVFKLKDGTEKCIPFEDEESSENFINKLLACF